MKTAASVFSWLGGIATTIIGFVNLLLGQITYYQKCDYSRCWIEESRTATPVWMWVLWIIFLIVRIIILIWRQIAVESGKKVACGVCTLLFASLIGGILTLCIPQDQLDGYTYKTASHRSSGFSSSSSSGTFSPIERAAKVEEYERELYSGQITREEFDQKVADLDKKPSVQVTHTDVNDDVFPSNKD